MRDRRLRLNIGRVEHELCLAVVNHREIYIMSCGDGWVDVIFKPGFFSFESFMKDLNDVVVGDSSTPFGSESMPLLRCFNSPSVSIMFVSPKVKDIDDWI